MKTEKLPKGVYKTQKNNGETYYRSSITIRGKHISLGSFASLNEAHVCYMEASNLLCRQESGINISIELKHLPFEKYVIICNYLDNDIYFGTPIYVYKRYFQYYLSSSDILTFDLEHLFYFSSHKIMRRGNHLFVADFGLQVSILARFGIRPYSVEGRDYRFINGDSSDLRYENIEISCPYHGVLRTNRNGKILYKSRIHIRSYYIIGTYKTITEAAIAYNKAVDILKKNGFKKSFQLNDDIEGISAKEYADIYASLNISGRIKNLIP